MRGELQLTWAADLISIAAPLQWNLTDVKDTVARIGSRLSINQVAPLTPSHNGVGGPAVNIHYVGMSPISSQGASVAQVPHSKRSFPIILPLYQQAAVAYLSIHLHICLRGCIFSLSWYVNSSPKTIWHVLNIVYVSQWWQQAHCSFLFFCCSTRRSPSCVHLLYPRSLNCHWGFVIS